VCVRMRVLTPENLDSHRTNVASSTPASLHLFRGFQQGPYNSLIVACTFQRGKIEQGAENRFINSEYTEAKCRK